MKTRIVLLLLSAALIMAGTSPLYSQNAEQLYQKALMKEEGEGNLPEAIEIFNSIVEDSNAEDALQAKALLHVGLCYEKLGKEEATKAYQKLVNNFPGQKNEVAIARERLSKLILAVEEITKTPLTPKFTKIKIPTKLSWSVVLSPDGKDLALVSDKKLWKMPLSGNLGPELPGTPVKLNTDSIEVEWTGLSWSQDGKWIAFNEYPKKDEKGVNTQNQKIYVIPSAGGKPLEVFENYRDARVVNYRISLSPDGKKLAFSSVADKKQFIQTISIDGNNQKQLVETQAREPVYSPDGNFIAFVEDKEIGRGEGDLGLWVMPSIGGTPHKIADAGKATSPVWSPDGNFIAFLDYTKGKQIFVVPFDKTSQKIQNPITIEAPEGTEEVRLLAGWTPDNKIGALVAAKMQFALYTLPAKGGQAAMILNDVYALQPRFSLDSKHVYYVTPPKEGNNPMRRLALASVSSEGGNGKLLSKFPEGKQLRQLGFQGGNRISPDGKTIISAAWIPDSITTKFQFMNSKIWKIPVDGSEPVQITKIQGPYSDGSPCWSPDGKQIAFVRIHLVEDGMDPFGDADIYIIDSSGEEPEFLTSVTGKYVNSLNWSPDGETIVYLTCEKEAPNTKALNVINLSNGESRVVGEIPSVHVNIETAWSPDSRRIAFNDMEGKVIKVMTLSDGSIEDISTGLVDVNIYHLDWSHDGERFVFGGWKGGNAEFWFLEDFLPLDKLAQNEEVKEPDGIKIRQIWKAPYLDDLGTVSLDGKYRSYVDWGFGNVGIHNLITDETKVLTSDAKLGEAWQYAQSTVISKDGKRIVYSWANPYNTNSLRLINVENSDPELLYKKTGEELYPSAWLSDKEILAFRSIPDNSKMQLVTFNIMDKKIKVKKTFLPGQFGGGLACSPDEKYIAYGFANSADKGNTEVRLLEANGDRDIPLITHPSNDKVLGWVPGRKEFLFISDRSGSWDLWAIKLDDTKPLGSAKRIYADIGEVSPMGFTRDGECYFGFSRRNFYSGLAPFNKETGEIDLESGHSFKGQNFLITWSPDGQYLAYIEIEDNSKGNPLKLFVQDVKSGEKFQPDNNTLRVSSYRWSPDGKSILVIGREIDKLQEKDYIGGIYVVDIETGQIDQVLLLSEYEFNRPEDDSATLSCVEWSLDKRNAYYLFQKDRLVTHNLETGEDKIIYKFSDFSPYVLETSPDGRNLLFGLEDPGEGKSSLFIMPAEGGKEKMVCNSQEANRISWAKYSPDGRYVYFVELPEFNRSVLWRVSVEGGKPEKIWSPGKRVEIYDIHPDGNRVAFSIRERTTEVRVIENLSNELEKIYSQNE